MKNFVAAIFLVTLAACAGKQANVSTDSTGVSAITDTMPVVNPGKTDSSGTITTPSTNDNNVIMPDSAVKSQ